MPPPSTAHAQKALSALDPRLSAACTARRAGGPARARARLLEHALRLVDAIKLHERVALRADHARARNGRKAAEQRLHILGAKLRRQVAHEQRCRVVPAARARRALGPPAAAPARHPAGRGALGHNPACLSRVPAPGAASADSPQPPWHGLWVGALLGGRVAAPWRLRLCPRALGRGGAVRPVHVVPMRARAGHGGALRCGRAARRRRSRRPLHRRPPERRPRACGPARRRSLLRLWLCRLYLKSVLLGLAQAASEDKCGRPMRRLPAHPRANLRDGWPPPWAQIQERLHSNVALQHCRCVARGRYPGCGAPLVRPPHFHDQAMLILS